MGGDTMIIAGFGFNSGATRQSFLDAMEMAVTFAEDHAEEGISALATAEDKEAFTALQYLSGQTGLPLWAIRLGEISQAPVGTSDHSPDRYGNRRLAEAAALIGAGPGGELLSGRLVSPDGKVTVALAKGPGRNI
jgi:cobalamin biosynthesis protein CbiG